MSLPVLPTDPAAADSVPSAPRRARIMAVTSGKGGVGKKIGRAHV